VERGKTWRIGRREGAGRNRSKLREIEQDNLEEKKAL
jgi:hypothetical protein